MNWKSTFSNLFFVCFISYLVLLKVCSAQTNLATCQSLTQELTYAPRTFNKTTMPTCCWWSASSCCFNQFSGQIDADGLRGLRQSLNRIAGNFRNPNCYYAVADLSCILCSPDTALWLELNLPGPPNVKVCRQTCDTGYLECQKDLDVLNTNSSIVFDGKTFCNHILQPLGMNPSIVQARDPSPCFFGVARYSQIEASENICLDAPPKSSASWLSPSISFWLLLFIIAVKVTHMSLQ